MSLKQRKLVFYSLELTLPDDPETPLNPRPLLDFLQQIVKEPNQKRIRLVAEKNKMQMLSNLTKHSTFYGVVFKSSKYKHRPPLLHVKGAERENPKTLDEGDSERTHAGLRFLSKEVILVLEERKAGLSIKMIMDYLHYMLQQRHPDKLPFIARYSLIPKGDFLEELKKMIRVKAGTVKIEKKLLGDEGIAFSNRTEEVKEEIEFRIQAQRGRSILSPIRDIFEKMESAAGVEKSIRRIRVEGTGENGRDAILDTDFIKRMEFLDADIDDETGVVNTADLFLKLTPIISGFSDS